MQIIEIYAKFKECGSVTTDTRTLKGGEMFFALKGENFDGNEYAMKALEAGINILIHIKQSTQHQEHTNHEYLNECTDNHVLLRFLKILTAQGPLHQILIQTGSSNHHKYTGNELFPKITTIVEVIKEKDFAC